MVSYIFCDFKGTIALATWFNLIFNYFDTHFRDGNNFLYLKRIKQVFLNPHYKGQRHKQTAKKNIFVFSYFVSRMGFPARTRIISGQGKIWKYNVNRMIWFNVQYIAKPVYNWRALLCHCHTILVRFPR